MESSPHFSIIHTTLILGEYQVLQFQSRKTRVCKCYAVGRGMCARMLIWSSIQQSTTNPAPTHLHTFQYTPTHTSTHRATSEARAPDRGSRSINYISAPAIKQGYYQAAAHRPGKAWPIKGCCDVGAGTRSCDSNAEWQVMLSKERKMERGKTRNGG